MKLRGRRLTAQTAHALWERFYDAYGEEQMLASYGRRTPHTRVERSSRVWEFSDDGTGVGWGVCSIDTNDSDDVEAMLSVGVFPDQQRKGYHLAILDWMAAYGKKQGAVQAAMLVLKTNTAHYERTMKHAAHGPWIWAGDIWHPAPGMGYFVLPLTDPEVTEASAAPLIYSASCVLSDSPSEHD